METSYGISIFAPTVSIDYRLEPNGNSFFENLEKSEEIPPFMPNEDERDQVVVFLYKLNKMNKNARLTQKIEVPFLPKSQFDILCYKLFSFMNLNNFPSPFPFSVNSALQKLSNLASSLAYGTKSYYDGGGCKKDVLGVLYFELFLQCMTDGELTQLPADVEQELSVAARDDDYQMVLSLQKGYKWQRMMSKYMADETVKFLASQSQCTYSTVLNQGLLNYCVPEKGSFSLVSWKNHRGREFDLAFSLEESCCFLESEVRLPIDAFLNYNFPDPFLYPIPEEFFFCVAPEGHGEFSAAQGLVDTITGVMHVSDLKKLNEHTWPMMLAMISNGRRFYEGGVVKEISHKVVNGSPYNLQEENIQSIINLITTYIKKHRLQNPHMIVAMACNACLALQTLSVSDQQLNKICSNVMSISPESNSFLFRLIVEGLQIAHFSKLMLIHQLFAVISLSVKKPSFQNQDLKINLTKHDGSPAIKICEFKTILLPFNPDQGFVELLQLASISENLEHFQALFEAYLPIEYFSDRTDSQLSSYSSHLQMQLFPLLENAKKQLKDNSSPFIKLLSFYLLMGIQTCIPNNSISLLIKKLPSILESIPTQERRAHLLKSLQNVIVYAKIEPWYSYSPTLFSCFEELSFQYPGPLEAWIDALSMSSSSIISFVAYKLWKQHKDTHPFDRSFLIRLIDKLFTMHVDAALTIFDTVPQYGVELSELIVWYALFIKIFESAKDGQMELSQLKSIAIKFLSHPFFPGCLTESKLKSEKVFMFLMNLFINQEQYANARELLLKAIPHGILSPSREDAAAVWISCFQFILSDPSEEPYWVSFWKTGKKYKLLSSSSYQKQKMNLTISLIEKFSAKNPRVEDFPAKMVKLVVRSWPDESRLKKIIADHMAARIAERKPFPKIPQYLEEHLKRHDKMMLQTHALIYEIQQKNDSECLTIIDQTLKMKGEQPISLIREVLQSLLDRPTAYQNQITKIVVQAQFLTLFSDDLDWIFKLVDKFFVHKETELKQFLEAALPLAVNQFASQYATHLCTLSKLSQALKEIIYTHQKALFEGCQALDFTKLTHFLISKNYFNNISAENLVTLRLFTVEHLESSASKVCEIHHIWKTLLAQKKQFLNKETAYVIQLLLSKLLSNGQITFASFWGFQLSNTEFAKEYLNLLISLAKQLSQSDGSAFQKMFEIFYQKQWQTESKELAWVVLAEYLLNKNELGSIYLLGGHYPQVVFKNLKPHTSKLLKPFLDRTVLVDEDLKMYASLIEFCEVQEAQYWNDLIKKINGSVVQKQIVDLIERKVLTEKVLDYDIKKKIECLLIAIPLLNENSLRKWIEVDQIGNQDLPARQIFYTFLLNTALSFTKLTEDRLFILKMGKLCQEEKIGGELLEKLEALRLLGIGKVYNPKDVVISSQALIELFQSESISVRQYETLIAELLKQTSESKTLRSKEVSKALLVLLETYQGSKDWNPFSIIEVCITHTYEILRKKGCELIGYYFENPGSSILDFTPVLSSYLGSKTKEIREEAEKVFTHSKAEAYLGCSYNLLYPQFFRNKISQGTNSDDVKEFCENFHRFEKDEDRMSCLTLIVNGIATVAGENLDFYYQVNSLLFTWLAGSWKTIEDWDLLPFLKEQDTFFIAAGTFSKILEEKSICSASQTYEKFFNFMHIFCMALIRNPSHSKLVYELCLDLIERNLDKKEIFELCKQKFFELIRGFVFSPQVNDYELHQAQSKELVIKAIETKTVDSQALLLEFSLFIEDLFVSRNSSFDKEFDYELVTSKVKEVIKHIISLKEPKAINNALRLLRGCASILMGINPEDFYECFCEILKSNVDPILILSGIFFKERIVTIEGEEIIIEDGGRSFIAADGTEKGQEFALKVFSKFFEYTKKFVLENFPNSSLAYNKLDEILQYALLTNVFEGQYVAFYKILHEMGEIFYTLIEKKQTQDIVITFFALLLMPSKTYINFTVEERIARAKAINFWIKKFVKITSDTKLFTRITKRKFSEIKARDLAIEKELVRDLLELVVTSTSEQIPRYHYLNLLRKIQVMMTHQSAEELLSDGFSLINQAYENFLDFFIANPLCMLHERKVWEEVLDIMTDEQHFYVNNGTEPGEKLANMIAFKYSGAFFKGFSVMSHDVDPLEFVKDFVTFLKCCYERGGYSLTRKAFFKIFKEFFKILVIDVKHFNNQAFLLDALKTICLPLEKKDLKPLSEQEEYEFKQTILAWVTLYEKSGWRSQAEEILKICGLLLSKDNQITRI